MSLLLLVFILQVSTTQQKDVKIDKPGMLEDILCNANGSSVLSKTVLILDISITHHINRSGLCLLKNVDDITIASSNTEKVAEITCSTANETGMVNFTAGFGFYNISRLNLSHISITNCGGLLSEAATEYVNDSHLPFYFGKSAAATLLFNFCLIVTIKKVNISEYYGFAILTINMLGQSYFTDLDIQDSLGVEYESVLPSDHIPDNEGSGILLYYLDSNVSLPDIHSRVELSRLTFVHNINFVIGYECIESILPPWSQQFSRAALVSAAGLSVIFSQESFSVEVIVDGCNFTENTGSMSAAMLLLYFNQAYTSNITVNNTLFKANVNLHNFCHGAAIVTYLYYTNVTFQQCATLFSEVWWPLIISNANISKHKYHILAGNLQNKYANGSGAVYIAMTYQCNLPIQVSLHNVSFDQNNAIVDGACLYAKTIDTLRPDAQRLCVLLEDITAYQNGQVSFIDPEGSVGSIFTLMNVNTSITGTSSVILGSFCMNNGSVVSAFQSLVHLQGFLHFCDNNARNGAVFNLAVSSQLILHENLRANFANNQAKNYGGAIYKAYEDSKEDICVIQIHSSNFTNINYINELNISLNFTNNTAGLSGQSIFATPVYTCQQIFLSIAPSNYGILYRHVFKFDDHEANSTENANFVSNPIFMEVNLQDINQSQLIYPGQVHTLCVRAYDEANKTVHTVLQIDLGYSDGHTNKILPVPWSLKKDQYMQILRSDQECTNVTLDFLLNKDDFNHNENDSVDIVLALPGVTSIKTIPLQMKARCPIGFMQSALPGACSECSQTIKNFSASYPQLGEIKCNLTTRLVSKPVEVWMLMDEHDDQTTLKIATACPVGYCKSTNQTSAKDADESRCHKYRQDILCGHCSEGRSMVLGTTHCRSCKDVSLLTIVVLLVGGILIIVSLFTFQITLVSGTINGLIFSSSVAHTNLLQIFQMTKAFTPYDQYLKSYTKFVQVFLNWMNLQLGFSVCLYDGMTALVKATIPPLFSIYLFLLVILIGLLSKHSQQLTNLISSSAIPVLATIVHISFSQLCTTSIESFMSNLVFVGNGSETAIQTVWHMDGNVQYYDLKHVALMVGAGIITISLLLPYTILVTFGLQLIRISFVNKYFKPFLDVVYAPYRDSQQYWFGARLLLLIFMLLIHAFFNGYQYLTAYIINGTALVAFTISQAFAAPFKSQIINGLDCWLMANTCIFYTSSWYFVINCTDQLQGCLTLIIISDVIGTFFFITFVVIVVYHILLVSGCLPPLLLFVSSLKLRIVQWTRRHTALPSLSTVHHPNYGSMDNRILTSSEMNSYSQLREPLLSM